MVGPWIQCVHVQHKVVEVACHRPERTPMAIVIRGLVHTIINTWVDQNWSGWEGGGGEWGRGAVVTMLLHVLIISVPTHCACSCRGVMQVVGMLMAHAFIATKHPLPFESLTILNLLPPPFFFLLSNICMAQLCCAVHVSWFKIRSFWTWQIRLLASVSMKDLHVPLCYVFVRVCTPIFMHVHARACVCMYVFTF